MNIHKTRLSLLLNAAVSVLGALSLTAAVVRESERWLRVFRYMTVIGTLYTTLLSCAVFVLGLRALRTGREAGGAPLYFLRLSAAVTESVIAIVIALSFLPSIPDDPDIFRFDSFIMHVLLPPLSVTAFVLGAPPQAKQRPLTHFNGSWLLTVYSAAVTAMIITGVMPPGGGGEPSALVCAARRGDRLRRRLPAVSRSVRRQPRRRPPVWAGIIIHRGTLRKRCDAGAPQSFRSVDKKMLKRERRAWRTP